MYRSLYIAIFLLIHTVLLFSQSNPLETSLKPVIIRGDVVAEFSGASVDELFLFAFKGSWEVIPFQIDERSENNRYTEPDLIEGLDANDEIVFMASDAGEQAEGAWIENTESQSYPRYGFQVTSEEGEAWAYLYRIPSNKPALSPVDYVNYVPPSEGTVKDTVIAEGVYKVGAANNGFPGSLSIYNGGNGINVLHRQKLEIQARIAGAITATLNDEDNFSAKSVAVKDGDVRVVRELTADIVTVLSTDPVISDLVFPINYYRSSYDISASLNITPDLFAGLNFSLSIVGMLQSFILNENASGLTFFNAANNTGISVDGMPDSPIPDVVTSEDGVNRFLFKGNQATFITEYLIPAIGETQTLSYEDNANADDFPVYGAAGFEITGDETVGIIGEAPLGLGLVFPGTIADGMESEYISTEKQELNVSATSQNYDEVTSVELADDSAMPDKFKLAQNYPNPFNPATKIHFSIPSESNVNITVYNLLGSMVTTLVEQKFSPGNYSVTWDGKDSDGNNVATGVYVYRLKSESIVHTKKMLLIK